MPTIKVLKEGEEHGGNTVIQLPFRCTRDFSTRLIRAKGSMMQATGIKVSDNLFFLQLLEIGLAEVEKTYGSNRGLTNSL